MYVAKSFHESTNQGFPHASACHWSLSSSLKKEICLIRRALGNFVKIHSVALHSKNSNFKKVRMKLSFGLLHETYCTCAGLDRVYHLYSHVFSNVHVNPP